MEPRLYYILFSFLFGHVVRGKGDQSIHKQNGAQKDVQPKRQIFVAGAAIIGGIAMFHKLASPRWLQMSGLNSGLLNDLSEHR